MYQMIYKVPWTVGKYSYESGTHLGSTCVNSRKLWAKITHHIVGLVSARASTLLAYLELVALSWISYMLKRTFKWPNFDVNSLFCVPFLAPTGEPQNFGITPGDDGPSSRELTFFWDLPPPTQRNGVITSYTVSCSPDTETLPLVETTLPGVVGLTVGGFRPFTEYMCTIVATNSQGSGPPATVTTMTNEDGECTCIIVN